jgi:cytoskeletal protein CcmA (bactofilin family)
MKFGRKESLFAEQTAANGNGNANGNGQGEASERMEVMPPARPPVRPRTSPSSQLNAFLGRGCIYEGKLTFEGRVRIDGQFTGEIFSNDTLEVGPDAEIEAEIDVATVIIAGQVEGDVTARVRCDLRAPGEVKGNITSPVVTMDEGVQFDGQMRMSSALDEAVRATTQRAPSVSEGPLRGIEAMEPIVETSTETLSDDEERMEAPAAPDPSELLNPVG